WRPSRARIPATELPAGPPPITMTSYLFVLMRNVLFSVQVRKSRGGSDPLPKARDESARSYHRRDAANSCFQVLRIRAGIHTKHSRQTSSESNRCRAIRFLTARPSRESIVVSA